MAGECAANRPYMAARCRASCAFCGRRGARPDRVAVASVPGALAGGEPRAGDPPPAAALLAARALEEEAPAAARWSNLSALANPAAGCGDASTLCAVFSSLGFCEDAEKAEDMFEHCRRTCGLC